jgi:GNAT superfamily N-acetyltransferase/DNA-binding MarR family transcriptional regulator
MSCSVMDAIAIDRIRSFNRTIVEGIGALEDRFLGRGRPMSEARVLWEIGAAGADLPALRGRLGLETTCLDRILRSLERQRLVRISSGGAPRGRQSNACDGTRRVSLTRAGLVERAELDRRSDAVALSMLDPLSDRQREAFVAAVAQVERLLRASMVRFPVENPASADAQWCFEQYFAELAARFEAGFDPALSISADAHELTPPAGALFIARLRGKPVGCGALKLHGGAPAELKRMWIAPDARSLGLGRRLLEALERYARDAGAPAVRLETNRALTEAIALYRRAGYVEVAPFNAEPYAHHWFEKQI